MKNNLVVALTGQSGVGKSSLAEYFVGQGIPVVDCDEVAKEIHSDVDCQLQLCEAFGADILKDGVIDKQLLAKRAFSSPENLQFLTNITHPFIINKILTDTDNYFKSGNNIVVVDGAVIIGHDFEKYCDKFIVILCDRNSQYERLIKRDGITLEQAKNRIAKQTKLEVMLKKADYLVYNNGTLEELCNQGENIIKSLKNL
ncbi:MAG: dephospho-CoA kinase [Oscillospiraceae bacterium]|nr:dephospho-CoA kinase [Oscillospiraceae bacterium]MBQ7816308.1 dephospho-CoA kinase [Oscillospiraceae bacterium]